MTSWPLSICLIIIDSQFGLTNWFDLIFLLFFLFFLLFVHKLHFVLSHIFVLLRPENVMSSASDKSRVGKLCGCHYRMVSYQCRNGPNKGRLFWRCPNWSSSETCNLFIWDEDIDENMEMKMVPIGT